MFDMSKTLEDQDPQIAKAIRLEEQRQEEHVELIASENYASPRVLAAQGSVLTNKYAEGYPGKRYYGGCETMRNRSQLSARCNCSAPIMPMCSRTRGRRRTRPRAWRCSIRAIRCWV